MESTLTGSLLADFEIMLSLGLTGLLFFYATMRRPVIGLAGFLFLVLARAHEYFPQLEKFRPSVLIGMVMVAGLFAHLWSQRQPLAFGKPQSLVLMLYVGVCWLSLFLHGSSYYDLNGKLLIEPLLLALVTFFVTVNAVGSAKDFRVLLLALGVIGVVIAIATLVQSFITGIVFGRGVNWIYASEEGILRRAGTLGLNPNDVAFALSALLPVSFWLAQNRHNSMLVRGVFMLSMPLLTLTAILTLSRGGFICLVCAWFLIFHRMLRAKYVLSFVLLALGVALFTPAAFWERLASTWTSDPTGQGRLLIYQAALNMISAHPLTGVGYGQFFFLYSSYGGRIWQTVSSHNAYLGIAAETGLINLCLFITLIAMSFVQLSRLKRKALTPEARLSARLLSVSLIVVLVAGLTGDVSQWVFLYLVIALAAVLHQIRVQHVPASSSTAAPPALPATAHRVIA